MAFSVKPWKRQTMLTTASACLQAPAMNLATCVAACICVWWGGGLSKRKQRRFNLVWLAFVIRDLRGLLLSAVRCL